MKNKWMGGSKTSNEKSPSGTQNTVIDLSAKDICNIIKECGAARVSEITIADLHIKFGTSVSEDQTTESFADDWMAKSLPAANKPDQAEPQEIQYTTSDREVMKEQFETQRLIDDPVGFETNIADSMMNSDR